MFFLQDNSVGYEEAGFPSLSVQIPSTEAAPAQGGLSQRAMIGIIFGSIVTILVLGVSLLVLCFW